MKLRIKRILSGVLALSLSMALTVPALAATSQTVAYNQGISLADAIQTVRNTVDAINQMKANGTVSDSKLSELAIQLGNLERAATGKEVTNELVQLVQDTEKAISGYGTSGAIKAQGALAILKMNLGITDTITDTITVENKEAREGRAAPFDQTPFVKSNLNNEMYSQSQWFAVDRQIRPVGLVGDYDGEVYNIYYQWNAKTSDWDWIGPNM